MNPPGSHISSKPQEGEGESMTATLAAQITPERIYSSLSSCYIFSSYPSRNLAPLLKEDTCQHWPRFSLSYLCLSPVLLGYHRTYPQISFFTPFSPITEVRHLRASRSPHLTSISTDQQTFFSEWVADLW